MSRPIRLLSMVTAGRSGRTVTGNERSRPSFRVNRAVSFSPEWNLEAGVPLGTESWSEAVPADVRVVSAVALASRLGV